MMFVDEKDFFTKQLKACEGNGCILEHLHINPGCHAFSPCADSKKWIGDTFPLVYLLLFLLQFEDPNAHEKSHVFWRVMTAVTLSSQQKHRQVTTALSIADKWEFHMGFQGIWGMKKEFIPCFLFFHRKLFLLASGNEFLPTPGGHPGDLEWLI